MPICFVISTPEENIVNAVPANEDGYPCMDGSLLRFRRKDVPGFLEALQDYGKTLDSRSEEYRACLRLQERMGSWVGQKLVQEKAATPAPARRSRRLFKPQD